MIKKAMILAAGTGTRLGHLTLDKPKALVEIAGMAMLHRLIERLKKAGIEQIIINVHHHAQQIKQYLDLHKGFGLDISFSDESNQLLDTGGALVAAREFFTGKNPILIHNADILTDVNLHDLWQFHTRHLAEATLFVSRRNSGRALLFNDEKRLTGWANLNTKTYRWVEGEQRQYQTLAYNGVWFAEPNFVQQIPFSGKFSIIDAWLAMALKHKIVGFENNSAHWFDMGTPEKIADAEEFLKQDPQ
ncbi:MAG: nucleotidyltransferase [Bacteroidetes bacterium CG18_big_fil_WC_8_21_14_2_50_41_14]|nr:MAG: nucleotidyltransferase [Bacteroidetes bacterium CG18_big_fil_WC_8_21_14_2_50_41_14]PJB58447.1 MAG: nucleotidyltransferase [Bacteroidetes bacterium CG_4_9_14_3_um_filter_41_19]